MKRIIITVIVVVVAIVAVTIYFYFDPTVDNNFFPKCFFYSLTGYQCPGCGIQRAIHCLLHGEWAQAWHYNAGAIVAVPVILLYLYAHLRRHSCTRLYNALNSTVAIIMVFVAIMAWWILRNIL